MISRVINSSAQTTRRLIALSRCAFGSEVNRRHASYERNLVQSPLGNVDIPMQNVTEYIFEGYEKYADKPAVVSIKLVVVGKLALYIYTPNYLLAKTHP